MALVVLGFGCGPAVADVVRKQDLSGKEALGAAVVEPVDCTGQAKKFKPLAVDWEPDKRVELEASMKKGLVAVKYDCKSFELIVECKLDGAYEYTGVSNREKVIKISDMDELSVYLPISSGSLGGEVRSGRTIDLALVMVGMNWRAISTSAATPGMDSPVVNDRMCSSVWVREGVLSRSLSMRSYWDSVLALARSSSAWVTP